MKTLFAFDLFPIRNSLSCYNWVNEEFLGICSRSRGRYCAWGDVEPRLLVSKQDFGGATAPVLSLPGNLREKLNGFCGAWDETSVERWKQLMQGRGEAAEVVCDALEYAHRQFSFDQIVYWGTNHTIRNFATSIGVCSAAMELGPTRYPFEETRYCDFAGVNGDAFTLNLKLSGFAPMDLCHWRKEHGIDANCGDGYGTLESVHADVINRHAKPLAVIALQLDDDANCLLYSDFKGMAEMVKSVVPKLVKAGWLVAVKPHPAANPLFGDAANRPMNILAHQECRDFIAASFSENEAFWLDDISPACYKTMLSKIDALICVNSSAGFEAMLAGKPVVVLGRAPFNMNGLLTLDDLINGYNDERYLDNVSRMANVMLNYYLYPKWQTQYPRMLACALKRTMILEEAARRGADHFSDVLLANPVCADAKSISAAGSEMFTENTRLQIGLNILQGENARLQGENARLQGENARLQGEMDDLLRSHSWRITKPIRALAKATRLRTGGG